MERVYRRNIKLKTMKTNLEIINEVIGPVYNESVVITDGAELLMLMNLAQKELIKEIMQKRSENTKKRSENEIQEV